MDTKSKMFENIHMISLYLGRVFFNLETLDIDNSGKKSDLSFQNGIGEGYDMAISIESNEVNFTLITHFSMETAQKLACSKFDSIDKDMLDEVALDTIKEFLNVVAGLFKKLFKYPKTFNCIGLPVVLTETPKSPPKKNLISKWFLIDDRNDIHMDLALCCHPKDAKVMKQIVVDEFKHLHGAINNIDFLRDRMKNG
ncbi:MAG: chemotaxis protein CheX [Oligoflexales bacterium]|nr:chemotaxis protein CheX [Oligoflexales bacterium]